MDYARSLGVSDPVRVAGISVVTPTYPDTVLDLPYLATDSAAAVDAPDRGFKESIADRVYEEAGVGPEAVDRKLEPGDRITLQYLLGSVIRVTRYEGDG